MAVGVILLMVVIIAIALKGRHEARVVRRPRRLSSMVQVLEQYEFDQGMLPPICTRDEEGNALHSWRTLVLQRRRFDQADYGIIDLSRPWDAPENRLAERRVPRSTTAKFHRHDERRANRTTHVAALIGTESFWDPDTELPRGRLYEYPNSILLIELPTSDIELFEPRDITQEELRDRVQHGEVVSFITAGGRYGIVDIHEDSLIFVPWHIGDSRLNSWMRHK